MSFTYNMQNSTMCRPVRVMCDKYGAYMCLLYLSNCSRVDHGRDHSCYVMRPTNSAASESTPSSGSTLDTDVYVIIEVVVI